MSDSRHRSPWEAPDCQLCGALDIYVEGLPSNANGWHCFKCDRQFNE